MPLPVPQRHINSSRGNNSTNRSRQARRRRSSTIRWRNSCNLGSSHHHHQPRRRQIRRNRSCRCQYPRRCQCPYRPSLALPRPALFPPVPDQPILILTAPLSPAAVVVGTLLPHHDLHHHNPLPQVAAATRLAARPTRRVADRATQAMCVRSASPIRTRRAAPSAGPPLQEGPICISIYGQCMNKSANFLVMCAHSSLKDRTILSSISAACMQR